MDRITERSINAVRMLSAEGVQAANSGHPGLPLGAASIGYTIFKNLNYNPDDHAWRNRDRFILSAGHGSMLLYSLFHLFGYGLTATDLSEFRKYGSLTPGHPEYRHTKGVETTTGPLGQGFANAVGMAQAECLLAAKFNKPDFKIVDHYTYCLCGDGCMQEGVTMEAASLAGTWGLGKLIVFYDSNDISIEGNINIAFRDNVAKRFEAQGWHTIFIKDCHDLAALEKAISDAKAVTDKPTLITVKTNIGYGSPLENSEKSHGAPLGAENLQKTREKLSWIDAPFVVPDDVKKHYADLRKAGVKAHGDWLKLFNEYKKKYPLDYEEYEKWHGEGLDITKIDEFWIMPEKADSTRNASGQILNKLVKHLPNLIGGSADLSHSNMTAMAGKGDFSKETPTGMNMHFGVREHAMGAICNGMYLHGGLTVFCATFFVFVDYMKSAVRMSAIMGLPIMYVLTHDSIGVGEDGATHQPVEQLAGLRCVPDINVWRPADYKETAAAYACALKADVPSCFILSRQNLTQQKASGKDAMKGGYIISKGKKETPDLILIATGSEVDLAIKAQQELELSGKSVDVVSMPCMEIFEAQPQSYKDKVLPPAVRKRVSIEAGSTACWYKYVGFDGVCIGIDSFGASGRADKLFEVYGFTVQNIVAKAKSLL